MSSTWRSSQWIIKCGTRLQWPARFVAYSHQPLVKKLPYANAAFDFEFQSGDNGKLVLEFFITPFDYAPTDPSRAVASKLEEGKRFGMSWAILDYDDRDADRYAGFWNLSHKTTMYGNASDLVAFRLMPIEGSLRKSIEANWSFQTVSLKDRGVAFRDQSFGNIQTWSWDFGDDSKSNEQHPIHHYDSAGEFVVTLHVAGPDGEARRTKVWDVTLP